MMLIHDLRQRLTDSFRKVPKEDSGRQRTVIHGVKVSLMHYEGDDTPGYREPDEDWYTLEDCADINFLGANRVEITVRDVMGFDLWLDKLLKDGKHAA